MIYEKNVLKIGEAAELLHVSSQTVRDWTDAGKLKCSQKTEGGQRLYDHEEVLLLSYAERGITTCWVNTYSLEMNEPGMVTFLDINNNLEKLSTPPASIPVETKLVGYRRLSPLHETLLLNGRLAAEVPYTFGKKDLLVAPMEAFMEADGANMRTFVSVAGFDADEVHRVSKELLAETVAWLKINIVPTTGIVAWGRRNGDKLPLF